MWTSKGKYDESGVPGAYDADRARDARRARHVRGEPGRFVSVRFETHSGNDQGVDCVGNANDVSKVVSPTLRRYSVKIEARPRNVLSYSRIYL